MHPTYPNPPPGSSHPLLVHQCMLTPSNPPQWIPTPGDTHAPQHPNRLQCSLTYPKVSHTTPMHPKLPSPQPTHLQSNALQTCPTIVSTAAIHLKYPNRPQPILRHSQLLYPTPRQPPPPPFVRTCHHIPYPTLRYLKAPQTTPRYLHAPNCSTPTTYCYVPEDTRSVALHTTTRC